MTTFLLTSMTIILAVLGSIAGNRWIGKLYAKSIAILSYTETLAQRSRIRERFLAPLLAFLFTFTALQHADLVPLRLYFVIVFEYFLILYTFTDFEQEVIFDDMLLPFAIFGALYTTMLGLPLLDHVLAAVAGGAVFLLLAVLTRGGIGGGDIKLIAALGLWLGSDALLGVVVAGLILGGIAALLLLVTGKKKRGEYFAYGPCFTIIALLAALS